MLSTIPSGLGIQTKEVCGSEVPKGIKKWFDTFTAQAKEISEI